MHWYRNPENGRTASMGWIGKRYKAGGTLFMGINPGGGTKAVIHPPPDDIKLYGLLRAFQEAREQSAILDAFDRLNSGYIQIHKKHNIGRRLIAKFLELRCQCI